ncbi:MAG: dimethylargininase [Anaerolineales bacterium]|jgi:dimethylargininase
MKKLNAITRLVSPAIDRCELTYLERIPIDVKLAIAQHHEYEETLKSLGVEVIRLPEEPDLPDSVFVEDAAIVLDECAIITRPGADSRLPETESVTRALVPYRTLYPIQPPGRLDGGDVLVVGKRIWVGVATRSNQSAIDQMQAFLEPYDYAVRGVIVKGCLHLKSAVTRVAENTLLINPAWVDQANFPGMKFIEVDLAEPYAANALMVGEAILYQPAYLKTGLRLEANGIHPVLVDQSELAKAEGALTCCSLIFKK